MLAQRLHPSVNRRGLTFWAQWICAMGLTTLVTCAIVYQAIGAVPYAYRVLMIVGVLGSVPIYSALHVYHKRFGYLMGLLRLFAGWLLLVTALAVLSLVCLDHGDLDNSLLFEAAVAGYLAQCATYLPLRYLVSLHSRWLRRERVSVIIGTSPMAYTLADQLRQRVPVLGLVATEPGVSSIGGQPPVLCELAQLRDLVIDDHVRRVYIALALNMITQIEAIYLSLLDLNVDVVWVPDFGSMLLLNQSVSQIEQFPAIYLNETPRSSHPAATLGKELFDRSLALLALLVLLPVMSVIALAVKLSSRGPVFFRQPRHGCNGEVIQIWKFRSMRVHEDNQVQQATRDDPRVTPVGAILRRTSLDELPQLINVLRGEMALVGPRPHAIAHNQYYGARILAYTARHRIKPGITGLAQVSGFRGETETLEKMQERLEKDLDYINHWSLWLDIKILLKTPFTLFSRNIY